MSSNDQEIELQSEKAGRPQRRGLLRIRAQLAEIERWRAAAGRQGVKNLSGWLRSIADEQVACGSDPLAWRRDLARLARDLNSGLGNNLNQLARSASVGTIDAATTESLARLASELAALRQAIHTHLMCGRQSRRRPAARLMAAEDTP